MAHAGPCRLGGHPYGEGGEGLEQGAGEVGMARGGHGGGGCAQQRGRQGGIGQLVFRRLLQSGEGVAAGAPTRNRVEQPELGEVITVGLGGVPGRLLTVAAGSGVKKLGVVGGGGGCGGVCREPAAQRFGPAHAIAQIRQVTINHALDVGGELFGSQVRTKIHDAGKPACRDGVQIVRQAVRRVAFDLGRAGWFCRQQGGE